MNQKLKKSVFGALIRNKRKNIGLSQQRLASKVGVSQPAISDIERGKSSPKNISLYAFIGLADALNTDIGSLAHAAQESFSDRQLAKVKRPTVDRPREPSSRPRINVIADEDRYKERQIEPGSSPSLLTAKGDELFAQMNWKQALYNGYLPALELLHDDRPKIHFLLHKIVPTYTNLCDFESSNQALDKAEKLHTQLTEKNAGYQDPEVEMEISYRRCFNEVQRGNFQLSINHALKSRFSALKLGIQSRRSSSYHFIGRSLIESQIPRLFPNLHLPQPPQADLDIAIQSLVQADEIDQNFSYVLPRYYDILWQSKGLFAKGKRDEGLRKLQQSERFFHETRFLSGLGYALIELARTEMLSAVTENDYKDTIRQLESILNGPLVNTQHPYLVTEAFILIAYCHFCLEDHRRNPRLRKRGADICNLVKRIYPYPRHPFHQVASSLERYFLNAMDAREYADYERTLEFRISAREGGIFHWFDNFL